MDDFTGIAGRFFTVVGLIKGFYDAKQTDKFRSEVVDGLRNIEEIVVDIQSQVKALSNKLEFKLAWAALNEPLQRIETHYDQWIQKPDDLANKTNISIDISLALYRLGSGLGQMDGHSIYRPIIHRQQAA